MALGAAATGNRAATGSCGQGLALMQEGIAELALNELPLVVFNMARGQQDYFQATRGGGWGDYRTITLAPKDVPEAVEHTQLLFHLADLYRTPVILYGDYVIAHTSVGIDVEPREFGPLPPKDWALDGTMTGTGRARQIWTWAIGKPNTPGPGPTAPGRRSRRSTPRSSGRRLDTRATAPRTPTSSWSPSGRPARSSTAWSTSCGPTGCGSGRSAPSRCGPSPATRWPRPPRAARTSSSTSSTPARWSTTCGCMPPTARSFAPSAASPRTLPVCARETSSTPASCVGACLPRWATGRVRRASGAGHGDDREEHLMTVDTPAPPGAPRTRWPPSSRTSSSPPSTSCARGVGTRSPGESCSRC